MKDLKSKMLNVDRRTILIWGAPIIILFVLVLSLIIELSKLESEPEPELVTMEQVQVLIKEALKKESIVTKTLIDGDDIGTVNGVKITAEIWSHNICFFLYADRERGYARICFPE